MIAMSDDGATILFVIVFKVVFGAICAGIASNRGRSGAGWFFIGCFFDCIALILVLVLPDLRQQQEQSRRAQLENRRLREQLAKERQVADHRHGHVERRLGVHDEALGLDTERPPELPRGGAPAEITDGNDRWFYARNDERQGPVSAETIRHLLQAGTISGQTLVWRQGMADWLALGQVDPFRGDVA
jgi:hypothetical protein